MASLIPVVAALAAAAVSAQQSTSGGGGGGVVVPTVTQELLRLEGPARWDPIPLGSSLSSQDFLPVDLVGVPLSQEAEYGLEVLNSAAGSASEPRMIVSAVMRGDFCGQMPLLSATYDASAGVVNVNGADSYDGFVPAAPAVVPECAELWDNCRPESGASQWNLLEPLVCSTGDDYTYYSSGGCAPAPQPVWDGDCGGGGGGETPVGLIVFIVVTFAVGVAAIGGMVFGLVRCSAREDDGADKSKINIVIRDPKDGAPAADVGTSSDHSTTSSSSSSSRSSSSASTSATRSAALLGAVVACALAMAGGPITAQTGGSNSSSSTTAAAGATTTGTTTVPSTTGSAVSPCELSFRVVFQLHSRRCHPPVAGVSLGSRRVNITSPCDIYGVAPGCPCPERRLEPGEVACGRPLLDATGTPTSAALLSEPDTDPAGWNDEAAAAGAGSSPNVEALSEEERQVLGAKWARAAQGEHASVASFNYFSLQLLSLGAPRDLVADAQRAALDEVDHARASFELAAAYLGHPVAPGAFPQALSVGEQHQDVASIAAAVAREGCVDEMASTLQAALDLAQEPDPAVRAVHRTIIQDEARHAGLAWRTIAWLASVNDTARVAARSAIQQHLPTALAALRARDEPATAAAAHALWNTLARDAGLGALLDDDDDEQQQCTGLPVSDADEEEEVEEEAAVNMHEQDDFAVALQLVQASAAGIGLGVDHASATAA